MVRPVIAALRARTPDAPDRGDIVVGWLVRVVVSVAVVGVFLFDAVSVGATKMSVTDQAGSAARAASSDWQNHHDQQSAFDAAWEEALDANGANVVDPHSFRVERGGTVHLSVHRTAPTVVLRLFGPLKHWADVSGDGVSRTDT